MNANAAVRDITLTDAQRQTESNENAVSEKVWSKSEKYVDKQLQALYHAYADKQLDFESAVPPWLAVLTELLRASVYLDEIDENPRAHADALLEDGNRSFAPVHVSLGSYPSLKCKSECSKVGTRFATSRRKLVPARIGEL